ncbi:11778_t:CDS:2 [Paraglomus brasilianum]|uniref:11778_t:CDS:1 n=1 Tax=Paraglomus brasilianum TaxID=144538 RepID=A0A9N8ZEG0_9GLOM|nr:11778_t:CDS:2 [Paraglomus brasilianum]
MSSWEVLVQNAYNNVQDGNLKNAYAGYLKAATLLLNKLATEAPTKGDDPSIAYTSVLASDANIKSNSIRSFQQLKTCIQHAEDILANRVINGTLPSPQSSFNDVTPLHSPSSNLPLVPFSPLTRQSLMTVSALATLSNKVAVTRQKPVTDSNGSSEHANKEFRKHMEELHSQKARLDNINVHIQTISTKSLIHWDEDTVAKQLTIIESQLFTKVDVRKDFLSKDKKRSSVQACLDFHRYLTNSLTHQFIIFADTVRSGQNPGRSQQNDNIIARGIKIAYLLLHVYRNFNSFAAIVKALVSPEVRRLRRLWVNLNTRTSQILKDLVVYISPANEYKAYKEFLIQKVDSYRDHEAGVIIVPWMLPHYEEIKSVSQTCGDSSIEALGARKRSFIFSLLEQCQSNMISADDDEWGNTRKLCSSGSRAKDTMVVDSVTMACPPDLSCLGVGDLGVYHWLVSRVYLTKRQLVDESLVIEPLVNGEPVLRVDEDELYDYNSDQISVEHEDSASDSGDAIDQKSSFQFPGRIPVSKTTERSNEENRSLLELQLSDNRSLLSSLEPYVIRGESSTDGNSDNNRLNETTKGNSSTATGSPFDLLSLDKTQTKTTVTSYTPSVSHGTSTPAINIPQTSSRSHPTQSSLPSDSSKSLNPNAPAFVPRSFGSKSNPLTVTGFTVPKTTLSSSLNDKFVYTPSATNGKTINGNDEDDVGFVYLGADSNTNNTAGVEEDDEKFVYTHKETNMEEDDDETPFVYSSNNNDENGDSNDKSPIRESPEDTFVYQPSNEDKKVPGSPKATPYVIGHSSSTGSDSDVGSGNAEIAPVFTKVSESKAVENIGGVDELNIKLNTEATD